MMKFFHLLTIASMFLVLGCSLGSDEEADSQDASADSSVDIQEFLPDVVADSAAPADVLDVLDDSSADEVSLDVPVELDSMDLVEVVEPCEATVIGGPWFVDSEKGNVSMRLRTVEDCPLDIVVTAAGEESTYVTKPEAKLVEFFGIPMIEMEGFYHIVELTFPAEAAAVSVSVPALSFQTELVVPQNANPLNMVLFGDTRTNHDMHEMVVQRIALDSPAVVVHTGDMVSGGGDVDLWDLFFGIEGEMLAHTMFAPTMGNHELSGEGFFDLFFGARWHREGKKRTYAQDYGLVGLVVLDNYSTGWKAPEDLDWLDATLEELSDKRWLIVAYHEPAYTFSSHGPWLTGREFVHPLMVKHGVDIVVSGHNHCYEHYIVDGIQYVVTGGGGAPLYSVNQTDAPEEELALFVNGTTVHHHVWVEATDKKLTATVIIAEDGSTYETFELD